MRASGAAIVGVFCFLIAGFVRGMGPNSTDRVILAASTRSPRAAPSVCWRVVSPWGSDSLATEHNPGCHDPRASKRTPLPLSARSCR